MYENEPEWSEMPERTVMSIKNVLCPDGKLRTFRFHNRVGDRGYVTHQALNISGILEPFHNGEVSYRFIPYPDGKNAYLLEVDTERDAKKVLHDTAVKMIGLGYNDLEKQLLQMYLIAPRNPVQIEVI